MLTGDMRYEHLVQDYPAHIFVDIVVPTYLGPLQLLESSKRNFIIKLNVL